MSEEAD
jgi:putative transposase